MKLILTLLRQKYIFTISVIVVLFSVFTTALWVATPKAFAATGINKTINFQGKLVDANGLNVAGGSYTVVFSLYTVSSAGTNIWTETQSVSTVDGIFQVQLGSSTTLPGSVDFNTDNLYLGIKVGADAEMTPRIRFTAVPYAFNAQKVAGLTVTDTTGTLTIPNSTTIQFGGAFTTSGANALTLTTTGATNITLPTTGTLSTLAGAETLTNKTIGSTGLTFSGSGTDVTTVSNEDFTVTPNGSGNIVLTGDADSQVLIGATGAATEFALFVNNAIGSNASLAVNNANSGDLFTASQAGSTKFRIRNDGSVEMGTAATTLPSAAALSIYAPTDAAASILIKQRPSQSGDFMRLIDSSNTLVFNVNAFGNAYTSGSLGVDRYAGIGTGASSGTQLRIQALTANDIGFYTAGVGGQVADLAQYNPVFGTVGAAFDESANLRIGQNAPDTGKLNVTGAYTGKALAIFNETGNQDIFTASQAGTTKFRIANNGDVVLSAGLSAGGTVGTGSQCLLGGATATWGACGSGGGGTNYLRLTNGAFSLVNDTQDFLFGAESTTSAKFKLSANGTAPTASVSGSTSNAALMVDNTGIGDLFTASKSGATKFVIKNNGNIGIGTSTPTSLLHIADTNGNTGGSVLSTGQLRYNGGASAGDFIGANVQTILDAAATGNITGRMMGAYNEVSNLAARTLSHARGLTGFVTMNNSGGAITDAFGGRFGVYNLAGSIGNAHGLYVANGNNDGTTTSRTGITIENVSGATNNTGILLGTSAIPTGNYGIYNASTNNNYFAGNLGIGTTTPLATFDVRGQSGTTPVASISGVTAKASLMVDNSGIGDLFAASKSGATKFVIKNSGYVGINNANPNYLFTVQPMFNGQDAFAINSYGNNNPAATFRSFSNGGQFVMYDSGNSTLLLNGASSSYFSNPLAVGLFGGDTTLAALDVRGPDGLNGLDFSQPVASISGRTGKATLVVDQSSTGDLFTASKSGAMKFTILNNGNLQASNYNGQNGVLYGTQNTGVFAQATTASSGQCLLSGASTPTWGSCAAGAAGPFNASNGIITEAITSNDFLIGGTATTSARFAVTGTAGSLGNATNYQTTTALPIKNLGGAAAYANGYVYMIGGNNTDSNGALAVATVYYAKVNGDGTFGSWVTTTSLPGARQDGRTVVMNGYLYYIGGADTTGVPTATVYVTKINADGTLGSWRTTASMPGGRSVFGIASSNGMIYVTGGSSSNPYTVFTPTNSAYYAEPNADGSITSWTTGSNIPVATAEHGSAIVNGYLYLVGGDAPGASTNIYYSKLDPTTGIPGPYIGSPTGLNSAIDSVPGNLPVVNGVMYVYGYDSTTGNMQNVFVNENGTVASVTTQTRAWGAAQQLWLPAGLAINGNLYSLGGMSNNQSTLYTTVQMLSTAKVQVNGSLDLVSLTSKNIASGSATGGTIYAGSISSTGNLDISGNAQIWNGASIRGLLAADSIFATGTNATTPAASIAARTNFAAMVVNNSGSGDLLTASSSGLTRFTISNNGSALFQGDSIMAMGSGGTTTNSSAIVNMTGDQGTLVPNSGFESAISGLTFADGWVKDATSSATVTRDTSAQAKGTASVKIQLTNTNAAIYSACIPIAGSTPNSTGYNLNYYARATAPLPTVRVVLDTYTSKQNCQSNTSVTVSNVAQAAAVTTAWAKYGTNTTAIAGIPATATWGRVHIQSACSTNCTNSIVNIDGVRLIENSLGGGVDYAENYTGDETNLAVPGDVVSMKNVNGKTLVVPANAYMDNSVMGVVSTEPGIVLDDNKILDPKVTVALAGRIPTKVSTKNGAIHIGDYLTSSDIPGVAVKAISAGPVIGQAMEEYNETDGSKIGSVVMFLKSTYYNGIPLGLNSGLTQDHNQGDLEFLGKLVEESHKTASPSSALNKIAADRIVAGLDIIAPKITTDTLQVNTIKSANANGLTIQLDGGQEVSIKTASNAAAIRFDGQGNAFFAGTITADKIKANQIEGLDILGSKSLEARVKTLEDMYASSSGILSEAFTEKHEKASSSADMLQNEMALLRLSVDERATISGNLRVKGNGLVEGIFNVVDTLTAKNLIVNTIADFFGTVIFHGQVAFQTAPTFSPETAGYTTVKKGEDNAHVTFSKPYETTPIVNASLVTTKLTEDAYKALTDEGICNKDQGMDACQKAFDKAALDESSKYVVSDRNEKGFTILLTGDASYDMTFSWTAIEVKDKGEISRGGETQ